MEYFWTSLAEDGRLATLYAETATNLGQKIIALSQEMSASSDPSHVLPLSKQMSTSLQAEMKEERVEQRNGAGGGRNSIGDKGVDEMVSANGGTQDTVTGRGR